MATKRHKKTQKAGLETQSVFLERGKIPFCRLKTVFAASENHRDQQLQLLSGFQLPTSDFRSPASGFWLLASVSQ
jgi:hypothetical protein